MFKINLHTLKTNAMAVVFGISFAGAAMGANPAPPVATPASAAKAAKAPVVPATIGTITDLSLEIKIAEKQKQLREIQSAGKTVTVPVGATGPIGEIPSISVVGAPKPAGFGAMPAKMPVITQPDLSIQSINSIGGKFTATSNQGRQLVVGSRFSQGDANWQITSITSDSVGAQKCVKDKCVPLYLTVSY